MHGAPAQVPSAASDTSAPAPARAEAHADAHVRAGEAGDTGLPPSRVRAVTDGPRLWPPGVDGELGWWPYLNLVYLFFAYLPLWFDPRADLLSVLATVAATLLFLPLYFAGYVAPARSAAWIVAAVAAIGFALIPLNPGGNTFLIYAIAVASHALSARTTGLVMVLLLALMAIELAWFRQPWPFLGLTAAVGVMVAVGSIYGRAYARRNAELRLSQDEVRRLARSAERERIGRDLHDLLGHTLSLIALKSELALKLHARDPAAARVHMAEVERIARESLAQVRRAVTGIRAARIEAELANARLALLGAEVKLDYRLAPIPLPVETETVLALALREAVTNVLRHAQARSMDVELDAAGGMVRLRIADDGRGAQVEPGNGLRGMRERVEALGGQLEVVAAPGQGVCVTLLVPLPDARAAMTGAPPGAADLDRTGT